MGRWTCAWTVRGERRRRSFSPPYLKLIYDKRFTVSEALQVAMGDSGLGYARGSGLSHVCSHQTVIGQEAVQQLELAGEYPEGIRLTKKEMKPYEARLERSATLPKYDITIKPKPTAMQGN